MAEPICNGRRACPVEGPHPRGPHCPPERVLTITSSGVNGWLSAQHGPLERIVLPREPANDEENDWVENELRTRLVPGGRIVIARCQQVTDTPRGLTQCTQSQDHEGHPHLYSSEARDG